MDRLTTLQAALHAGDALGSTSEFKDQNRIPHLIEDATPWPFEQVGGGPFHWAKDDPTDDGQQAILLAAIFKSTGTLDPRLVRGALVDWYKGNPPDVGGTTAAALSQAKREGTPWYLGGFAVAKSQPSALGNGSLMRNGVIAGMFPDLLSVFDATWRASCVTHAHPLSVLCCMAHSWLIWTFHRVRDLDDMMAEKTGQEPGIGVEPALRVLLDSDEWVAEFFTDLDAWEQQQGPSSEWVKLYRENFSAGWVEAKRTLRDAGWGEGWDAFERWESEVATGIGYVLVSLQIAMWAARWAIKGESYPPNKIPKAFQGTKAEDVYARTGGWTLAWVACLGGDSDTYAAIAGPLIAATGCEIPTEITPACYLDA